LYETLQSKLEGGWKKSSLLECGKGRTIAGFSMYSVGQKRKKRILNDWGRKSGKWVKKVRQGLKRRSFPDQKGITALRAKKEKLAKRPRKGKFR